MSVTEDSAHKEDPKLELPEDALYFLNNSPHNCVFILGKYKDAFYTNKEMLASRSPVFKQMLFGPLAEKGPIIIPEIECETFMNMIYYISPGGELELSNTNQAANMYYAAHKYQLVEILDLCLNYMHPESIDDVFLALDCALLFDIDILKEACMEIIREKTQQIFRHPQFLGLTREAVLTIIKDGALSVPEHQILIASVEWARHQCMFEGISPSRKNLRSALGEIFTFIRFLTAANRKWLSEQGISLLTIDELQFISFFDTDIDNAKFHYINKTKQIRSGNYLKEVENLEAPLFNVMFADHIEDSVTCLSNIAKTLQLFHFKDDLTLISVTLPSRIQQSNMRNESYIEDISVSLVEVNPNIEPIIATGKIRRKQDLGKMMHVRLLSTSNSNTAPVVKAGLLYRFEVNFNAQEETAYYPYPFCMFSDFPHIMNTQDSNSYIVGFKYCK